MSVGATGSTQAATQVVTILIELDPLSVYRKARDLVRAHPESTSVVSELVNSYGKVLSDLHDDFAMLEKARQR